MNLRDISIKSITDSDDADCLTVMPPDMTLEYIKKIKLNATTMHQLKSEHPDLFKSVSLAMLCLNPLGLNYVSEQDEFDREAASLIPLLKDCHSKRECLEALYRVFCYWFCRLDFVDHTALGRTEYYKSLANRIWEIWQRHRLGQSLKRWAVITKYVKYANADAESVT